ncbi:MAG TPA: CDGSH iron-sulfur domain-containing protein [Holophagaceae bacterium]|nr:CDGSH iron-sulfur domain-containing protein [Holophagaceae bacterium]
MSEPVVAAKEPAELTLEPGTYLWCACGLSENQPYCDGRHIITDIRPMKLEITRKRVVFLCQCKQSGQKPYCDKSHEML